MKEQREKKYIALVVLLCFLFSIVMPAAVLAQDTDSSNVPGPLDIKGHWAENQITNWVERGLAKGYQDGNFIPNKTITRAEFITLINRAFGMNKSETVSSSDVQLTDWFYNEFCKAKAAGYISGYQDGTMKPNNSISRQEVAAIISKLLGMEECDKLEAVLKSFSDKDSMPQWSKNAIASISTKGFMNGYPDKSFQPSKSITRAEAIATLDRVVGNLYTVDGVNGPEEGLNTISGNATINNSYATLQNTKITGNLILADGIGEGEVTLRNVEVIGDTYIKGGTDSIYLYDCSLNGVIVNKAVKLVSKGSTNIRRVRVNENVILDGNFAAVEVKDPGKVIELDKNGEIETLNLYAKAEIKGKGKIKTANIYTNGVVIEKKPQKTVVAKGFTAKVNNKVLKEGTYFGSSGGGGGGGRSSSGGGSGDDSDDDTKDVSLDKDGNKLVADLPASDEKVKIKTKVQFSEDEEPIQLNIEFPEGIEEGSSITIEKPADAITPASGIPFLGLDITLKGIPENQKVKVELPIPEGLNKDNAGAYHHSGQVWEYREAKVVSGKLVFETTLSPVAVAEKVGVPSELTAKYDKETGDVTLEWKEVANADGYKVYKDEEKPLDVNVVKYIDGNVASGEHTYYVKAYDERGNVKFESAKSNVVKVKVEEGPAEPIEVKRDDKSVTQDPGPTGGELTFKFDSKAKKLTISNGEVPYVEKAKDGFPPTSGNWIGVAIDLPTGVDVGSTIKFNGKDITLSAQEQERKELWYYFKANDKGATHTITIEWSEAYLPEVITIETQNLTFEAPVPTKELDNAKLGYFKVTNNSLQEGKDYKEKEDILYITKQSIEKNGATIPSGKYKDKKAIELKMYDEDDIPVDLSLDKSPNTYFKIGEEVDWEAHENNTDATFWINNDTYYNKLTTVAGYAEVGWVKAYVKVVDELPADTVEASIDNVVAKNGKLIITLVAKPTVVPEENDFIASISINGADASKLALEDFEYDDNVTVSYKFTPIVKEAIEQSVVVAVKLGDGKTVNAEAFIVPVFQEYALTINNNPDVGYITVTGSVYSVTGSVYEVTNAVYGVTDTVYFIEERGVSVNAIPDDSYKFVNWLYEEKEVKNNPFEFGMPANNVTLIANYDRVDIDVNKDELKYVIYEAKKKVKEKTQLGEAVAELENAIKKAQIIIDNEATQKQVNTGVTELIQAMQKFDKSVNHTEGTNAVTINKLPLISFDGYVTVTGSVYSHSVTDKVYSVTDAVYGPTDTFYFITGSEVTVEAIPGDSYKLINWLYEGEEPEPEPGSKKEDNKYIIEYLDRDVVLTTEFKEFKPE